MAILNSDKLDSLIGRLEKCVSMLEKCPSDIQPGAPKEDAISSLPFIVDYDDLVQCQLSKLLQSANAINDPDLIEITSTTQSFDLHKKYLIAASKCKNLQFLHCPKH